MSSPESHQGLCIDVWSDCCGSASSKTPSGSRVIAPKPSGGSTVKLTSDWVTRPISPQMTSQAWASEAKHGHVFVKMALNYFDEKTVYDRLAWWIEREGEIIESLEIRAALH